MRKSYLIIVCALISINLFAEDFKVVERVYVSTDKDVYVAGDNLWCSAFCFDISEGNTGLSDFSSTVYVELASDEGITQTGKIALIDGRGAGVMALRTDLPTGNYSLCAYTTQNRNEEGFVPVRKIITIFNTLSLERVKDNVVFDDAAVPAPASDVVIESDMKFTLPESISTSSIVPMSFQNPYDEPASISVSIYKEDTLSALNRFSIVDYIGTDSFKSKGTVTSDYIPDYEGEVIHLTVSDIHKMLLDKKLNLFCSASGTESHLFSSYVDSLGKAEIYTNNICGERDLFCQVILSDTLVPCKITIEDPFVRYPVSNIPKLHISHAFSDRLAQRGIGMQIGKRFGMDTLYSLMPIREDDFMGQGRNYHLDNYTRFPLMSELFIEFIPEIMITKRKGSDWLRLMLTDNFLGAYFSTGMPLFLLDGVPLFDHSKIVNYDPLLVKDLCVYTNRYAVGNVMFEGAVRFDTYKGNLPSFDLDSRVSVFKFHGSLIPAALTAKTSDVWKKYPDYRQTIYWNPIVSVASGETFDFECKTPIYSGDFVIVVEGVTESGKPILSKSSFHVR